MPVRPLHAWRALLEEQQAEILAELETVDWFLSHAQAITQDPGAPFGWSMSNGLEERIGS